ASVGRCQASLQHLCLPVYEWLQYVAAALGTATITPPCRVPKCPHALLADDRIPEKSCERERPWVSRVCSWVRCIDDQRNDKSPQDNAQTQGTVRQHGVGWIATIVPMVHQVQVPKDAIQDNGYR